MKASDKPQCPICTDTMSLSITGEDRGEVGLNCCGQIICQSCLYRHIQSIFEEGITGQGRSKIQCPVGCGKEISDRCIRHCIRRSHPQRWPWPWLGKAVFNLLVSSRWFQRSQDPLQSSLYYDFWMYWTHSLAERHELMRYERWSLAVALRSASSSSSFDHAAIMYCPAPDCDYAWITNQAHRQYKVSHEQAPSYFFWYSPPKAEAAKPFWVLAEYVNMLELTQAPEPDERDGRRMVCGKCHCIFCGLCRRPWTVGTGRRTQSHRGVSCRSYARRVPNNDMDFHSSVGQLTRTRTCPGCSVRTHRIDGCNHMTCPCGAEWCYVCECRWHPRHYGCVDAPRNTQSSIGCIVS